MKAILCFSGRCSFWGKSWKYHKWTITQIHESDISSDRDVVETIVKDNCWRCGMSREQAKED